MWADTMVNHNNSFQFNTKITYKIGVGNVIIKMNNRSHGISKAIIKLVDL